MATEQSIELKIAGLWTNPSSFSETPRGSMLVADNLSLDRESILETRRGFQVFGNDLNVNSSIAQTILSIFSYQNKLITSITNGRLYYDQSGTNNGDWVQYPPPPGSAYRPPMVGINAASRIRGLEANKNFYFLTSNGTYKLDSITSAPKIAGAPKGLGGAAVTTGASGFFPNNTNIAYRIVWGYRDLNGNLILGPPSERIVATNTSGGLRNVSLTFQIPKNQGIDTTWFYQVYRSPASVALADPPNDNMKQCFEGNPTASQLFVSSVTGITDSTPDSLLQTDLYTSVQGILQANFAPPFAQDIALFKGYTFYARTRTPQRTTQTLISTSAPSGLQNGDMLAFTDTSGVAVQFNIVGAAFENAAAGLFKIFSTGDPALDIQNTALSIVKTINSYAVNQFISAYYVSDFGGTPGQMMFERNSLNANAFYINSNRATAFASPIELSGQATISQNDDIPNRIYISKFNQPEAVPLLQFIDVGSANKPIQRIIPMNDSLLILKDDGVYRIFNKSLPFQVVELDPKIFIIAVNSAVLLDNRCYFLSNQGVARASENTVEIISRPIEDQILKFSNSDQFPNLKSICFGIGYESDHKYILALPLTGTDINSQVQFVYNFFTNQWTKWTRTINSAIIYTVDGKLYTGSNYDSFYGLKLRKERKTYTRLDYADEDFQDSITNFNNDIIELASSTNIDLGDTLVQGDIEAQIIKIINPTTVQVDISAIWNIAPVTVYNPITTIAEMRQNDCENPGIQKQIRDCSLIFSDANFSKINLIFKTDIVTAGYPTILINPGDPLFGEGYFGDFVFGGQYTGKRRLRTQIPHKLQRCNWMSTNILNRRSFSSFSLSGMSMIFTPMSERNGDRG